MARGSSRLFSPITIRDLVIKNRIFVSPMCQYSARDGIPGPWHLVHLGARAVGGAGLVMVEATAVSPQGRISPSDTGLWNAEQAEAFKPIVDFIAQCDAIPAVQLAHAGRKAGTAEPWNGGRPISQVWDIIAPSPKAFSRGYVVPREMTLSDIENLILQYKLATSHALLAGFRVIEIHMAHGYLLHEFLSPLTNQRQDQFGGSLENRMRLPLAVTKAVREIWPSNLPIFVRLSAQDWVTGGWDLSQSIELSSALKQIGVDLIDVSSGGIVPDAVLPSEPNFQVPLSRAIRNGAEIATAAVGQITNATLAEQILVGENSDAVMIGREFLRDPYFPMRAAIELGSDFAWPKQYLRAKP